MQIDIANDTTLVKQGDNFLRRAPQEPETIQVFDNSGKLQYEVYEFFAGRSFFVGPGEDAKLKPGFYNA